MNFELPESQFKIHNSKFKIRRRDPMSLFTKATHNVWTGMRYWSYKTLSFLSGIVPLRFSYWVGALVGDFGYLIWKRHSANAVSNMRRVMGDSADWRVVKETTRDAFRN